MGVGEKRGNGCEGRRVVAVGKRVNGCGKREKVMLVRTGSRLWLLGKVGGDGFEKWVKQMTTREIVSNDCESRRRL
jgi:hypothetical protein